MIIGDRKAIATLDQAQLNYQKQRYKHNLKISDRISQNLEKCDRFTLTAARHRRQSKQLKIKN